MGNLTIALDAMGGDYGPHVVIPAAIKALHNNAKLNLLIYGRESEIKNFLDKNLQTNILSRMQIIDTPDIINDSNDLLNSVKTSHTTSMYKSIEAVANNLAQGCVSAGSTAVLMALSKILLTMLDNIERPALVAELPSIKDNIVILDVGANLNCSENNLYQFSLIGKIYAETILNKVNPRVALLNIGTEENKGTEILQKVYKLLSTNSDGINFVGFIEGNNLLFDKADVIIADGINGNIAIKTLEGMAEFIKFKFTQNLHGSLLNKLKMTFTKSFLRNISGVVYPEKYSGASLLGLNAIVIKTHANSSINSFTVAIEKAFNQANNNIHSKIQVILKEQQLLNQI